MEMLKHDSKFGKTNDRQRIGMLPSVAPELGGTREPATGADLGG
jgi:hypothetical protein